MGEELRSGVAPGGDKYGGAPTTRTAKTVRGSGSFLHGAASVRVRKARDGAEFPEGPWSPCVPSEEEGITRGAIGAQTGRARRPWLAPRSVRPRDHLRSKIATRGASAEPLAVTSRDPHCLGGTDDGHGLRPKLPWWDHLRSRIATRAASAGPLVVTNRNARCLGGTSCGQESRREVPWRNQLRSRIATRGALAGPVAVKTGR